MPLGLSSLFMISNEKRLQTYFGYPTFMTCAKPIMRTQMPPMEYISNSEMPRSACTARFGRCRRNYYSPFE